MAASAESPLSALQRTAEAVVAQAGPAVVRVGRHGGRGCGVVVAEDRVLTNAHNLRDRTTEVTFADGRAVQGELTGIDADGDLAVLAVDTAGAAPLPWATTPTHAGALVFAVGQALDGRPRVTFGMVSGVERAFRGPRGRRITGSLEHTAPLVRGSSGSALVDEAGQLLGINTARLGEGFYLALPADDALRERVDALVRGESPRRLVLGVGLAPAEVAAKLRASVGLPARAGLLVRMVAEGSPAARSGLQVGDLLTAAGDAELATVDDLHVALDAARQRGTLELRVVRGTEDLEVVVSFEESEASDGG
ncbi:MAG: S1C family serine protease [Acidimicrobiales bacterium]